jgi:hypothetical protein
MQDENRKKNPKKKNKPQRAQRCFNMKLGIKQGDVSFLPLKRDPFEMTGRPGIHTGEQGCGKLGAFSIPAPHIRPKNLSS